jgi:acetaldehyde dehydrogenase (acetylating)
VQQLDPDLAALQEVRDRVERAERALEAVARFDQAGIDRLCEAIVAAAVDAAGDLARLAVEETGIGRYHYKILKTLFGSEGTWAAIRDEKSVGIIGRDDDAGIIEIATPFGIVACIVPTTNPTSTALHNALISIKGRNSCVISPHPRAARTIGETVRVMRQAIERAGGPPDLVQSLSNPTIESTGALMKHRAVSVILATGGTGLVQAAYSSGKPAFGVGPGNVPCYVDRSADVEEAARWIVASQSFDNGTLCCSEQSLILDRPIVEPILAAMRRRGAHLCCAEEVARLAKGVLSGGHMRAEIVGLDPWKIAQLCGFEVPRETTLLLAPQAGVGCGFPLTVEILCPLVALHEVDGWEEGCEVSLATLRSDGLGHTLGLWARDRTVLDAWFLEKPANRIIVNGPTSQGAIGYSTNLTPSVSLGCGPQAGNITSDNITARHLINIKRVAFRKPDWERISREGHARAAEISGERAPRGTGLEGDPALGVGGAGEIRETRGAPLGEGELSNWRGNLPSAPQVPQVPQGKPERPVREAPVATAPKSAPPSGGSSGSAPRFTEPRSANPLPATAPTRTAPPTTDASPPPSFAEPMGPAGDGPYVGMSLTPSEIQGILAQAGAGCPLGPCEGCTHSDATTGSCSA